MLIPVFAMPRLARVVAVALVALVLVGCNSKQTQSAANAKERVGLQQYWIAAAPGVALLARELGVYLRPCRPYVLSPHASQAEVVQWILVMKSVAATIRAVPPSNLATAHRRLLGVLNRSVDRMLRQVASGRPVGRQLAVMRSAIASWAAQVKHRAWQLGLPLASPIPRPIPI
jgi:hypothetical protein